MPRKTKEDEKNVLIDKPIIKKEKKIVDKTKKEKEVKTAAAKKVTTKKTEPKKTTSKTTTSKKTAAINDDKKVVTVEKKTEKKETSKVKKEPKSKTAKTIKKETSKSSSLSKEKPKQAKTLASKKAAPSSKKAKTTKTTTPKTKKTATKSTKITKTNTKKTAVKKEPKVKEYIMEYYDLPNKYNQTTVKVLAQNPEVLYIYWEISDEDTNNYIKQYGVDFFQNTKPILKITNKSKNYSFEIDINDYANCWYLNVPDAKCEYTVELARIPIRFSSKVNTDYIAITKSNTIEIPNDHVLFFNSNDTVEFQNVKTKEKTSKKVSAMNLIDYAINNIYKEYNLTPVRNRFDLKNPISNNPTSSF